MPSLLKKIISGTALVLAAAAAFSALAQAPATPASGATAPGERPHGKGMKRFDTNNDKMISRNEAKGKPMLTKNFDAIDANQDGQLSRDEMKAYRQAHGSETRGELKGERKGERMGKDMSIGAAKN